MKADVNGEIATLTIESYADLLAVRALPEWHMTGAREVRCDIAHLHTIGMAADTASVTYGTVAPHLFDYQRWIVDMALERERFAVFADCGLGKTAIQLEWLRLVLQAHGGRGLIVAPLQVVHQTVAEAARFYGDAFPLTALDSTDALRAWLADGTGVGVTNHEKVDGADEPWPVRAVVLDESSVLKQSMGQRRTSMVNAFKGGRFKLACSATPAPNDRVEYAEHAYWLDVVRSTREFLAAFFVNRDGQWQLKGHGRAAFYRHLAAWSVFMRHPAAYGFADNLADLEPLSTSFPHVEITAEQAEHARRYEAGDQPSLFGATPGGITSRTKMAQIANGFVYDDGETVRFPAHKPDHVADIANNIHAAEQVLVWVQFDAEGDRLAELIPDATVLSGRTPKRRRAEVIEGFRLGEGPRVLVCKPSMFGFGLNLQSCRVQVFSSMSDSYERFYQAVRRSHRYGQTKQVRVYVPLTGLDEPICQNVLSKQATWEEDGAAQQSAYVAALRPADTTERRAMMTDPVAELDRHTSDRWTMIHGDCVPHMNERMEPDSVDLAVFSPPFANLFTYSSEAADMGNVRFDDEYRLQWEFFCDALLRVMRPGRVVAVHCMDVIRFAGQHGHRHTYDYPSDLRAGMERAGFTYHARIAIDKNPQIQATRTKDANLLFATLKRDALDSHPQASECVLVFRKPGDPAAKVQATDVSNQEWIRWAHHIWYDIRETDVLNAALGKANEDERHICPLQLGLIERCVRLWSNPDETVFSPFAGIGSEGFEALGWGRRFYGVELKDSYFTTACRILSDRDHELSGRLPLDLAARPA